MIPDKKYVKIVSNAADGSANNKTVNNINVIFTENGLYEAEAPYTGYGKVRVDVPNGTEEKTVTQNGIYVPTGENIGFSKVTVEVNDPVINSLSITPTTSQQVIEASGSVDGYAPITVGAVTSSIDNNIKASNIKSGVSILGVSGNVTELKGETRSVSLSSSAGNTFTPSSGKNGITSITVAPANYPSNSLKYTITPSTTAREVAIPTGFSGFNTLQVDAVTSSIDSNIVAGNIKNGVQILGVTGNYSGSTTINIESLNITPTTSQQVISASGTIDGYAPITVSAVTSSIDANILSGNIKSGVTILGVTGNVVELKGETKEVSITSTAGNTFTPTTGKNGITSIKVTPTNQNRTVTPTTSQQTLSVNSGYSGNGTITVNAVTSSIDSDIIASNIKSGVNILGVAGSVVELNGETRNVSITSTAGNTFTPSSGKNGITSIKVTPTNQNRTVTPTTSQQTLSVNTGYSGNGTITVSAVTSAIDSDIVAGNIKSGVNILGVNGTLTELKGETRSVSITSSAGNTFTPSSGKNGITSITVTPTNQNRTVTPTTSQQTLNINSGYSGNGTITVSAVTSAIDSNITAGNIKSGITILGVTGTAGKGYLPRYVDGDVLSRSIDEPDLTGIKTLGSNVFRYAFYNSILSSTDFLSNIITAESYSCDHAFSGSILLTNANLASLKTIKQYAFQNAFEGCTNLTNINLSSLETVESNGCEHMFWSCPLPSSIVFSSLKNLYSLSLSQMFARLISDVAGNLTSLSFPALTSTSFNSYTNCFNQMLYRRSGVTVHFPSNLQSVIGSWSSVTGGFGGTNITVLFDLTATS